MRVLPFLFVIFLLTSVLAVPVPSSDLDDGEEESPALSSDWRVEVVDSEGAVYFHTSLAIDRNGGPHISYYEATNADLKYANRTGLAWNIVTVDNGIRVGSHSSLALDENGIPHISYYDQENGDLRYANWTGGYWNIEIVDSEDDVGRCTSIAVDESGYPRVVYPDLTNGDLKYANWTGTEWNIEIVDSYGVGYSPSLTLDSRGYPHISYRNSTGMSLNYATWTESGWDVTTVDSYGDVGMMTSIDLDSHEYPHISYLDTSYPPPYYGLKHANWTGDVWAIETVDSDGDVGGHSSIALDSDDNPHISYQDLARVDLKYAVWTGSAWSFEIVDSYGFVGWWTSMALDDQDRPHISYVNYTSYDLKYATKADLQPPSRSVSLDIDPDTLNLKSEGRWVTAYVSAENASVNDINISSILLQDTLEPERWDYQDDILMLKFNRQDLIALLEVGESVEIKLSGKWKDGTAFEAYDYIGVINPAKK